MRLLVCRHSIIKLETSPHLVEVSPSIIQTDRQTDKQAGILETGNHRAGTKTGSPIETLLQLNPREGEMQALMQFPLDCFGTEADDSLIPLS